MRSKVCMGRVTVRVARMHSCRIESHPRPACAWPYDGNSLSAVLACACVCRALHPFVHSASAFVCPHYTASTCMHAYTTLLAHAYTPRCQALLAHSPRHRTQSLPARLQGTGCHPPRSQSPGADPCKGWVREGSTFSTGVQGMEHTRSSAFEVDLSL